MLPDLAWEPAQPVPASGVRVSQVGGERPAGRGWSEAVLWLGVVGDPSLASLGHPKPECPMGGRLGSPPLAPALLCSFSAGPLVFHAWEGLLGVRLILGHRRRDRSEWGGGG